MDHVIVMAIINGLVKSPEVCNFIGLAKELIDPVFNPIDIIANNVGILLTM
jgi:hypothetical protein